MILLKDVLREMEKTDEYGNPVPFSMVFCTYSKKRRTGGELISVKKAIKTTREPFKGRKKLEENKGEIMERLTKKNPHHHNWKTRNIEFLPSGQIRKIRIRLILEFNGTGVIY